MNIVPAPPGFGDGALPKCLRLTMMAELHRDVEVDMGRQRAMAESQTYTGSTVVLQAILRNVLDQVPADHEIAPEQQLMNLGVTSLQLMRIVAAIEQELDIEFPDSALDMATFETVGSLAAVVESLTGDRSEPLPR